MVGQVILFVVLLAGFTMLLAAVFAYAAPCYLVAVQETAAGNDRVVWPKEPIHDRLGDAFYLAGFLALCLTPAGVASRALRHDWLPDANALRLLLLAGPLLWLGFPVALLSSLSASSRWVPLRPVIVGRMLTLAPSTLGFYLSTGVLLALTAVVWYLALFTPRSWLLLVAAPVGAAVLLIHARLLGRLARLVQKLGPIRDSGPARRAPAPPKKAQRAAPRNAPTKAADTPDPPARHLEEGYGLADAPPAQVPDFWSKPRKKRKAEKRDPKIEAPEGSRGPKPVGRAVEVPPEEGYEVRDEDGPPPQSPKAEPVAEAAVARELALRVHAETDPEPAWPLLGGVYTFPWYPDSQAAWLTLTLAGLVVGLGVRALVAMSPV